MGAESTSDISFQSRQEEDSHHDPVTTSLFFLNWLLMCLAVNDDSSG